MIDEIGNQATGLDEIAFQYIDVLADRAKAIVTIAAPFAGEIAIAAGCIRGLAGAQPPERQDAPAEGGESGAAPLAALSRQIRQHPLASLAIVGALAAAGYYVVRRR